MATYQISDGDVKLEDNVFPVPSLSLSFANESPASDDIESSSMSGSGRRSSSKAVHYSPYPVSMSPRSPRLNSPHSIPSTTPRSIHPSQSPLILPSSVEPPVTSGRLTVEHHRRIVSDSTRTLNQESLARMVTENRAMRHGTEDSDGLQSDTQSEAQSHTTVPTPSSYAAMRRPEGARHRRSKSDSSSLRMPDGNSMQFIPSADGFRLVIPAEALQSLKEMNSPDQSVTVLLTRESSLSETSDSGLLRVDSALGKASTRPKHYKCSKCGQPKKGHVCEFASDKPVVRPGKSMSVDHGEGSNFSVPSDSMSNGLMMGIGMGMSMGMGGMDPYNRFPHSGAVPTAISQMAHLAFNRFNMQSMNQGVSHLPLHTQFPQSIRLDQMANGSTQQHPYPSPTDYAPMDVSALQPAPLPFQAPEFRPDPVDATDHYGMFLTDDHDLGRM